MKIHVNRAVSYDDFQNHKSYTDGMLSKVSQELRGQNRRLETDIKNIEVNLKANIGEFLTRKEIEIELNKISGFESTIT